MIRVRDPLTGVLRLRPWRRVLLLADAESNRRLFITLLGSHEAITAAEQRFDQMGDEIPEEVRGRRTSVDAYEVVFDEQL